MEGGTFQPCRKCDYLFNHTYCKDSGGTEGEALCLKKMKYGNSVKAVMSQYRFVAAFFIFPGQCIGKRKEGNVESLREVKRVMEREAKKGSCPLMFDRLEFGTNPFQTVTSEEKLDEVLAWLLRLKSFRQYAEKTIINNVYMDWDLFCKNPQFKRTRSVIDRERIYAGIQRYKKRLKLDYDRGLCLETVRCVFLFPQEEAEKYRIIHDGQETYAFILSNKYILGLFTYCDAARKSVVSDGVEYGHLAEQEQRKVRLECVEDVLFQALLLDDVEYTDGELSASLYTIYCMNEKE